MNDFYVYAYIRLDGSPYYIGKGRRKRAYDKDHCIFVPPDNRIQFMYTNLTESTAFALEIFWIAVFGRKDLGKGVLHNKTDGGDGSSNPSLETRKKLSVALQGRKSPMTGRQHTAESKERIRKSAKESYIGRIPPAAGKINVYGKPIMTPFGRYNSAKHAASTLNIVYHKIIRLCAKPNSGWYRIE